MDQGLWNGNFFDYQDDDVAKQREFEIADTLTENYVDETFPPNSRSLYFDPLNPPKGGMPNDSMKWYSISEKEVLQCEHPNFFNEDLYSSRIKMGALGNSYFVNTLALLSCQPKFIHRLLVSNRFASKGLYTFKFYKNGKWRYVHIDDYIPCRQSGKVHFCRNTTPNETYAMLIEKAYAKLHGCYEALTNGVIEKLLLELTPAAGVTTLRLERIPRQTICDEVWEIVDKSISRNALIGCGRFIADPLTENPAVRQGLALGTLYQILDMCVCSAEPTEDFDAVTVGMVCVRTLQASSARFNGRWSYGHPLWFNYKEIALDLRQRTREIQYKRGIGPSPTSDDYDAQLETMPIPQAFNVDEDDKDDEADDLDLTYNEQIAASKVAQPVAEDLQWIQIEDFVEIFNRIYIIQDLGFEKRCGFKRYVSQWLPGDGLVGSGGPPVIVIKEPIEADDGGSIKSGAIESSQSAQNASVPDGLAVPSVPSVTAKYRKVALINDNFTDNPMYPMTVTEPTRMYITLYQPDKRWNRGRLGEDPQAVNFTSFVSRKRRLESVMDYPVGIGFLILKLSGLNVRVTDFRLKKVAHASEFLSFSNAVTATVDIFPGRYAIVPYTHRILDRAMDYALHVQYYTNHIDFEVEDAIAQRLRDKDGSVNDDAEGEPEDNDLLRAHEDDDDVSILSYEKVNKVEADDLDVDDDHHTADDEDLENRQRMVPLPKLFKYHRWEYSEDIEEVGLQCMYGEVGDLMKYLKTLKGEVDRLQSSIRSLSKSK